MYATGSRDAVRPLSRILASGRWLHEDGELTVVSGAANPGLHEALADHAVRVGASPRFSVFSDGGDTIVLHRLQTGEVDNDLTELVAGELVRPGRVTVPNAFERCFAGIVLSSASGSVEAWRAFYENTLSGLERAATEPHPVDEGGPITAFGRIYAHARSLVEGHSLLDVGTCFGFFPLLLRRSEPGLDVTAVDLSEPMLELARDAARHEGARDLAFEQGDARDLPFADGSFDTVAALHVLEHLEYESARRALQEMCRAARRRVIVAVPLEEEPDRAYGHLQSFGPESLMELARSTGWRCGFEEYLGGWAILEPS